MRKCCILLFVSSLWSMDKIPSLLTLSFKVCMVNDIFNQATKDLFCQVGLELINRHSLANQIPDANLNQAFDVIAICNAFKTNLKIKKIAKKIIKENRKTYAHQIENRKPILNTGFCKLLIRKFENQS